MTDPPVCVPSATGTHTRRDCRCGTARRSTRRVRQIPGVSGEGRRDVRELRRRSLPYKDGPGGSQPAHAFRVLRGKVVRKSARSVGCRHTGRVDGVLDADDQAGKRSNARIRVGAPKVGRKPHERPDLPVVGTDSLQAGP